MIGITERARAFFREHPVSTERKVNQYLTEHMPRLAREYKLATSKDSASIDANLEKNDKAIDELEDWRLGVTSKVDELKMRVTKMELKRG